jgi:hypothetical protein
MVPESAVGKTQLLYAVFLWMMVVANFERALPGFAPQRLITEGVIILNATICTVRGAPQRSERLTLGSLSLRNGASFEQYMEMRRSDRDARFASERKRRLNAACRILRPEPKDRSIAYEAAEMLK